MGTHVAEMVPAATERAWMNQTHHRFAYRCIPMTAANALGWELLNPTPFSATWTGGTSKDDIIFRGPFPIGQRPHSADTHFGHGVLTFHPGYLFRTEPGFGLVCRGIPNAPKDGIQALEGFVETDWLPFPFTMNWLFTRPGTVHFEKGEPFCFISVIHAQDLERVQPEIKSLDENPELKDEYEAWRVSRNTFNQELATGGANLREKWQKFYVRGKTAIGSPAPGSHKSKRTVLDPK